MNVSEPSLLTTIRDMTAEQTLRGCWLPIYLGDAAAMYAQVPTALLRDALPNLFAFGPHHEEFMSWFAALDALLRRLQAKGVVEKDEDSLPYFYMSLLGTYRNHMDFASTSFKKAFGVAATDLVPTRVYVEKTVKNQPHRRLDYITLADLFPAGCIYDDRTFMAMVQLVTGLILLQYLLLQHPGERLQALVQAHNDFCARWALPSLHYLPRAWQA